jgi:hypothetical protein
VRYALALALILAPVLYLTACGGGGNLTGPPSSGTLAIRTSTAGPEPDADGYTFQIDGGPITPIASSATTSSDLAVGTHSIRLTGLADNCTVADNPRSVTLVGGQTTTATFAVTCTPTTGSLTITAATTGPSPDADGYQVTVDGADSGALPANGSLTLAGLLSGTHSVGLSGVAANCQVQGDNPRPAVISGGQTGSLSFTLVCTTPSANAGTLDVVTATSGPAPDPDGYTFAVDGGAAQVIDLNATVELPNTPAGIHIVQLSGVAANCAVDGTNPRTVTVRAGGTDEVRFTVTCGSSSMLVWHHMDTGTSYYLQGIWGSSTSDLFTGGETAGDDPTSAMLHFDGQAWTEQLTAPNKRVLGVWGSGPTDVFAVGFNSISAGPGGLLFRYNGSSWTQMEDPSVPDPAYLGVWGSSGSDVYAVGEYFDSQDNTLVSHFDGASWTQVVLDDPDYTIATDVHGTSATDVYVVGYFFPEDAYFVRHYDGSAWTVASFEGGVLSGVWANAPNDVFAVGFDGIGGFILHSDGSAWSRMTVPPATNGLGDVWGSSSSDVYAVGGETILHYDGSSWSQVSQEGGARIFGLSATDVYVVGSNGSVLRGTPPAAVASRESRVTTQSRALVTSHSERREVLGARSYGLPTGLPRPLSVERRGRP